MMESDLLINRSIKNNPDEHVSLSFAEPISEEEIFMVLKNNINSEQDWGIHSTHSGCLEDERPDL